MANFPSSVSTNSNLYIAVNGVQTTLASPITNSVTTIPLTSTSGFPTTGLVTIENNEVVSYTGISGANLTGCTRGADGTTALAHSTGVSVGLTIVAAHHNLLKDEIIAIETALGASFTKGNITAGSSKISVTGGTGAIIGSGVTVDIGTFNLGQLSNVVLTSPATNDLLSFNGTNWVNVSSPATSLPLTGGTMTGDIIMSNQTGITLKELTANGTSSITLRAADDMTATYTIKFPPALGSGNQVLTDVLGNGVLSWTTGGGSTTNLVSYVVGTASGTYSGSTTVFALPFAYTSDNKNLEVYYDGIKLVVTDDYTETNTTTVTMTTALTTGRKIQFRSVSAAATAQAVTAIREDYIVGTSSGTYTGSLTVFNLAHTYTLGGTNLLVYLDGDLQTLGATVDYLETSNVIITFNNSLVTGQKVSFLFTQTASAAPGIVNSGTANTLAAYPATGAQVGSMAADASAGGFKITSLASGVSSTDATNLSQLMAILAYRRPTMQWIDTDNVDVENNTGNANETSILFPDGNLRTVVENTGTTNKYRRFTITATANFTAGTEDSGLRSGLSRTANTYYAILAVKSQIDATKFVLVGDTTFPTQANFATLNSRYGTNSWVYLCPIANGDNSTLTNVILSFEQTGNCIHFTNALTVNGQSLPGILLASAAAGNFFLTVNPANGTSISAPNVPPTVFETTISLGLVPGAGNIGYDLTIGTGSRIPVSGATGGAATVALSYHTQHRSIDSNAGALQWHNGTTGYAKHIVLAEMWDLALSAQHGQIAG